jgi:hypothetical protein
MNFNSCEQRTIYIDTLLTDSEVHELYEFMYRAGYRGYVPDFENLSTPESEFLEVLTNAVGIEFGSTNSLMVFVGEITFHVMVGGGVPYNYYRLPQVPKAES